MTPPSAARLFNLGDAGSIVIGYSDDLVQFKTITPGHGWRVAHQFPSGWLAKRRPSNGLGLTLRNGPDDACTREAELEIGLLADGRWEIAQRQSHDGAELGHIDVGCGSVKLTWDGRRLTMDDLEAVLGWRIESTDGPNGFDGSWDLVVIWTNGEQDVELVVHCVALEDPPGRGLIDIDRRERVPALG